MLQSYSEFRERFSVDEQREAARVTLKLDPDTKLPRQFRKTGVPYTVVVTRHSGVLYGGDTVSVQFMSPRRSHEHISAALVTSATGSVGVELYTKPEDAQVIGAAQLTKPVAEASESRTGRRSFAGLRERLKDIRRRSF